MTTRSENISAPNGLVGKVKSFVWNRLGPFKDPDRIVRRKGLSLRSAWWRGMHAWYYRDISRRRRLAAQLPRPSVLRPIDPSIGASFTTGAAVTALTAKAVSAAQGYLQSIDLEQAVVEGISKKSYLVPLAKKYPIPLDSPIFDLALHPEFVGTVAAYFGYLPILTEVNVWYSPVWEAEKEFIGSQRYHLDNEDFRQIKVFVYLHDVDADHSPTMFLGKKRSLEICKVHYDDMRKDNIRIDEQYLREETVVHNYGPTGSVSMLDTSSCLHAGGRCKKVRSLLVFQYLTPCSHVRNKGTHERFQFLGRPGMNDVDRTVLNLD